MSKDEMISEANFDELISMIEAARARAWQAVNSELVALYWNIGRMAEFYNAYKDDEFVTPLVTQITWTNH